MRRQIDSSVLEMALVGFNAKRDEVVQKMADIERQLGIRRKGASAPSAPAKTPTAAAKPRRRLSAAGKRAIRAALKKRWAGVLRKDRCRETRKAECEEVKENDATGNQGEAGGESG